MGSVTLSASGHFTQHGELAMTYRLLDAARFAGLVAIQALAADITIEVRGVRSGDRRVLVAVHGPQTKDSFPLWAL